MATRIILVGGFLGAGKTTLLWEATKALAARGLHAGLVTNDQAPALVDTALLSRTAATVAEVNGSCFCCNFPGLLNALSEVKATRIPDVIVAEPVGSCTDLSATIIQPLKDRCHADFTVAPLTVMADPLRLLGILDGGTAGLHPSAAYIYRKQLEEADVILISKVDLLTPDQLRDLNARTAASFPRAAILAVSSKTSTGIDVWLDAVLAQSPAGRHIAEVDYDRYAEGEAVLGWLNATLQLRGQPTEWRAVASALLSALAEDFDRAGVSVGHVKLLLESGSAFVVGNLTGTRESMEMRGSAFTSAHAKMTINARVEMSPGDLESTLRKHLKTFLPASLSQEVVAWRCLSPGRPKPTYRYDHVVAESPA
jgi:G3E family GTPase